MNIISKRAIAIARQMTTTLNLSECSVVSSSLVGVSVLSVEIVPVSSVTPASGSGTKIEWDQDRVGPR